MTAVPKPLKFLRPHYDDLTAVYDKWPAGATKVRFTSPFHFSAPTLKLYVIGFSGRHALGFGDDVR